MSPDSVVRKRYEHSRIKDDHPLVKIPTKRGMLGYGGGGNDSRTCHMWVAVADSEWLGKAVWETPVARVISGMDVMDQVEKVGDMQPWGNGPDGSRITNDPTFYSDFPGDYLRNNYPGIDYWEGCSFPDGRPAADA